MKPVHVRYLILLLLCCPLLRFDCAEAKGRGIPIPIFFGHGDKIIHLMELPNDVKKEIKKELKGDVEIGFLYERFHIFFLDVWTWNGRYVLYEDEGYYEIPEDEWAGLLGSQRSKELSIPILYRIPAGGVILCLIAIGSVLIPLMFPSPEKQVRKLFEDERYTEALKLYSDKVSPSGPTEEEAEEPPIDSEKAFALAIEHLKRKGVNREDAERNLQLMFHALAVSQQRMANG